MNNFPELSALIAVVCNLALALFVFARNLRSHITRVYLLWGISVVLWNLGAYHLFRVEHPADALFWATVLQFGVILLPVSNLHLCLLVSRVSIGRWLPAFYLIHIGLLISLFCGYFIQDRMRHLGYVWYSMAGPGFLVFVATYAVSTTSSMIMLYLRQRRETSLHRTPLKWLMFAIGILIVFGTNDLLPVVGLKTYPYTDWPIYPYGSTAAIFYVILITYSVLHHQLLDIKLILSRYAAQSVRILLVTLLGLTLLLFFHFLGPDGGFSSYTFCSAIGALVASTVIASICFPKLLGKGEERLERRLLGDRFEYHDRVRGFIEELPLLNDHELVYSELRELLSGTMGVRGFRLILRDPTTREWTIPIGAGSEDGAAALDWRPDLPLFDFFQETHAGWLPVSPAYSVPGETSLEREARAQLVPLKAEFCFPLRSADDLFGFLVIGDKATGEPYTAHDLQLLKELSEVLSQVINRIQLRNQVLLAEELELMGRMSRGMAHDLNNLLTPVSTFLQLCDEGEVADRQQCGGLLTTALRNVVAMQGYIKEALFFSQNHAPDLKRFRVDDMLRKSVLFSESRAQRKNQRILVEADPNLEIEADEVLLQRLVANVISNASDASPEGGSIRLTAERRGPFSPGAGWIRLEVSDDGCGISPENLKRVRRPYFTTKDHGDTDRGFGLGLAICRKIVHLHHGNLSITSEERKGTVVRIDLPAEQAPELPADIPAHG